MGVDPYCMFIPVGLNLYHLSFLLNAPCVTKVTSESDLTYPRG